MEILAVHGLGASVEDDADTLGSKVLEALLPAASSAGVDADPSGVHVTDADYRSLLQPAAWRDAPKVREDYTATWPRDESLWACNCCRRNKGRSKKDRAGVWAPKWAADQYLDNQHKPLKAWLRRPTYRDAIRQEIANGSHAAPDIVIAHSMGSLVAIDLIAHMAHADTPRLLVTLGSPLAIPSVWEKLPAKLQEWTATRSTAWVNLYDRGDLATFSEPLPSRCFPRVINIRVRNVRPDRAESSHSARRYLSHGFLRPLIMGYAVGVDPLSEVQAKQIDALRGTHRIG